MKNNFKKTSMLLLISILLLSISSCQDNTGSNISSGGENSPDFVDSSINDNSDNNSDSVKVEKIELEDTIINTSVILGFIDDNIIVEHDKIVKSDGTGFNERTIINVNDGKTVGKIKVKRTLQDNISIGKDEIYICTDDTSQSGIEILTGKLSVYDKDYNYIKEYNLPKKDDFPEKFFMSFDEEKVLYEKRDGSFYIYDAESDKDMSINLQPYLNAPRETAYFELPIIMDNKIWGNRRVNRGEDDDDRVGVFVYDIDNDEYLKFDKLGTGSISVQNGNALWRNEYQDMAFTILSDELLVYLDETNEFILHKFEDAYETMTAELSDDGKYIVTCSPVDEGVDEDVDDGVIDYDGLIAIHVYDVKTKELIMDLPPFKALDYAFFMHDNYVYYFVTNFGKIGEDLFRVKIFDWLVLFYLW